MCRYCMCRYWPYDINDINDLIYDHEAYAHYIGRNVENTEYDSMALLIVALTKVHKFVL